jgi:hypothetical protein
MKSRLFVLFIIAVGFTLASGGGLEAGSSDIWNTGHITAITYNTFPRIKGTCLVWQGRGGLGETTSGSGDWEIFLYDLGNQVVTQVTDDDYDDISPQTDGDYVVWQKHDTSRTNQIFLYKIHGENPPGGMMISNDDDKDNYSPQIAAGLVVWTSQRVAHSFEPGEIMLYDATNLSGPDVISDTAFDCCSPRINSETVVWVQSDGSGGTALFMYDLTSETPVPEPAPEDFVWTDISQTDGNLTVLTRHDGSDSEVFMYNARLHIYEQITHNASQDRYPSMGENCAVALGGEGETSGNPLPISAHFITWMGGNAEASEIYLALHEEEAPAIIKVVGATTGTATDNSGSSGGGGGGGGGCFISTAAFGSTPTHKK